MPTCPTCFVKYPDEAQTCDADGTALVPDATFAHIDRDLEAGVVIGEYTVERKLGEGGFGAVYAAVHPLIGKRAAVKILSRQFSSNPQMVSRFVAEARAVNQIRHRNIIDIFSFGQLPDGRQYYIMELLEGATFDAYLAERGRLSVADAIPILRGIARALDAAHAKGILHRDLKPENVFLVMDEDGRVEPKLLDFGLVKLVADATSSHKTKTGTPMGTPYYMSPEQSRGHDVDARTDIYSFGAMIFQVLTGHLPYEGDSTLDILVQHMNAPVPRASERCADLPPHVDALLTRMLAKAPADRPATAGEAIAILDRSAGVRPPVDSARIVSPEAGSASIEARAAARTVLASPPSGPAPVAPATFLGTESDVPISVAQPKRAVALILGAVVSLLALGGVVVAMRASRPPPPAPAALVTPAASASSPPIIATVAPAASTAATLSDEVDLKFDGIPEGTTVTADGARLGTGSGPFKLARGKAVKLIFAAKGYKPKEMALTPSETATIPVSLEKASAVAAPAKTPGKIHSDLEGFDDKK